mmetsp:Transcript_26618/g.60907  ORF Transcript_26618/g.60907 Transcript_26618/m.60907 type:complete len:135 (-) Transcript_26618:466-870(-)
MALMLTARCECFSLRPGVWVEISEGTHRTYYSTELTPIAHRPLLLDGGLHEECQGPADALGRRRRRSDRLRPLRFCRLQGLRRATRSVAWVRDFPNLALAEPATEELHFICLVAAPPTEELNHKLCNSNRGPAL